MNKLITNIFDKRGGPILIGLFATLMVAETISVLRTRKQRRSQRVVVNSLVAVPGFLALRLLLLPAMVAVAFQNERWRFGINRIVNVLSPVKNFAAFLFLDYSNYIWHILNHKLRFLWRFHLVHHTDADLDVTTAIRFHAGEMFTSIFYRTFAVLLSGASPTTVLVYEIFFEGATQFHHSNWRLPLKAENVLNKLIVTPRMHGIHHSIVRAETDSNYSVIFSFWDRLHETLILNKAQDDVIIGVEAYPDIHTFTSAQLLQLPFNRIRD